ncbi:MAG: hypothetical protein ACFFDC_19185 [Promethearchaeota archaeon]
MSTDSSASKISDLFERIQVGPGFGLLLMGTLYLVFWLMPFALESYTQDPRWAHNWAYAIILMTIGAAFHHKSVVSRIIAMIQGLMMPLTASGAFNAEMMTLITIIIGSAWLIVMLIEQLSKKMMLQDRLSKRSWNWVNMHSLIVCWILMAHMGLVFFIGRLPFEAEMATIGASLGRNIGILANLPEERHDLVTYMFDINLIILALLFGFEQFKLGYNLQNKPWPRISFWYIWITLALGIILLPVRI